MKFGKSSASAPESQHIDTLIGELSSFKGELAFEGVVRIDGKFEGNLCSQKDGTLIISESGRIVGDVDVPRLILHGAIKGNVRSSTILQICARGRLAGDVEYATMTLSEGAEINGHCTHITEKVKAVKKAEKDVPRSVYIAPGREAAQQA